MKTNTRHETKTKIARVLERLDALYDCGEQENKTHSRIAYSPYDKKGRDLFQQYFRSIGIEPYVDEAGNIHAVLEGSELGLPSILIGSHLDTVPDGGKLDGALGCMVGLEICEVLHENNIQLRHPLEVIVFTDEEGSRFGTGMFGSKAFCGNPMDDFSQRRLDADGNERKAVLKTFGIDCENLSHVKRDPESICCYLELHVEQGRFLEKAQMQLGVVSGIAGLKRYFVSIDGEANHAGSTLMKDRKDALVAASAFISQVPEVVKRCGTEFSVATVGSIQVSPGSVNVVPGWCEFSLEMRDQTVEGLETIQRELQAQLSEIERVYNVDVHMTPVSESTPAAMDETLQDIFEDICKEGEYSYKRMSSGAFHDALPLSNYCKTGMLFVPSVGGISHSPGEYTHPDDIHVGCELFYEAVLRIDNEF